MSPMPLNLPALDQLSSCRNLLIAGMGGGFDIFCGLPIYKTGVLPLLANYRVLVDHQMMVRRPARIPLP